MELNKSNIKLIIGLGNPSEEYKNTYHNVGFSCVDFLNQHLPPTTIKLEKSNKFMNNSGKFVKEKIKEMKIDPENILIIQDDSDINIGGYKFSFSKGSAGHKGIQSIIDHLGAKNFWRLRIGIRPEGNKQKAESFVLNEIKSDHNKKLEDVFFETTQALKNINK